MLPSRGFFKKNDCPFFEKGLCMRPHCHFRHKKKVICENSSSLDSREDLLLPQSPPVKGNDDDNSPESSSCNSNNKTEYCSNETFEKEESIHDSLFAKLVKEYNPYEKISRHIPCAYTPTPQNRGVEPKKKAVSLKYSANDSKDVPNKTHTLFDGYKSVNNKNSENMSVPKQAKDSLGRTYSDQSVSSSVNSLENKHSQYKISFFYNNTSDYYEPQSAVKSGSSEMGKGKIYDNSSDYVPSKVTAAESQYVPNRNDSSLSFSYVPSKDKPKQNQYVPEPTTGIVKNQMAYKPSDKTSSCETKYQPESSNYIAKYVPTEKSTTNSSSSWLDKDCKNKLTEIEFVSSEIEMMKELLRDEADDTMLETDESTLKTESIESKAKNDKSHKEKHKSSRSHHSSHSSSTSRSSQRVHSSSSKSKSSSRHSSKSSHSDRHRSSSSSNRERHSSSHKKSRHHSSRESHRRKSKKKKKSDNEEENEKPSSKLKEADEKSFVPDEDSMADGYDSDLEDSSGKDGSSDVKDENESKKRKVDWDRNEEDRKFKFLKKGTEELFEELEDDPEVVERECLEIFNSYAATVEANAPKTRVEVSQPSEDIESTVLGKKRTAHSTVITSDHSVLRHKTSKTLKNSIKSAQEVMLDRYKAIEKTKETQSFQPPPQPSAILGLNKPSIKIAAVSNIQQMLWAKKAIQEKINRGIKVNERTTIAHTLTPGTSRVAHTPAATGTTDKPTVNGGSKQVPRMKRQIYLEKLLLETNQIYPTKGESAEEALKLEEEVFRANSGSSSAYHAAFVSLLLRTRRRVTALKGETSKSSAARAKMSHYDVLSGGKKNFSVLKVKKVDISMLTERHIYDELYRCKLTPEELKENGFPMESDRPGYASCSLNFELKYNDKYNHIKKMTRNRRFCIRCSKEYEVDPVTLKQYKEGPETCFYHPGKKKSGGRYSDRIYNCCNSSSSEGCTTHVRHVTDCNDYERLPNCVKTLSKEDETNPGVFALDCEMVYTRLGYELARVTVVNLKKEIVYDTLVKPKYPIECYNTLFSGIEEKMMEGVKTTLKDVQAVLLSLFSEKTILIGHSLDSDLRALHLIHNTVVDTAVVYKNEKYHPYKYSLKDLCAKKISKIIQDNVNGHDSAEDAVAALEIMLNYVKEEVSKYESLESYEADRLK